MAEGILRPLSNIPRNASIFIKTRQIRSNHPLRPCQKPKMKSLPLR